MKLAWKKLKKMSSKKSDGEEPFGSDEEVAEDCMLCLEAMQPCDRAIPMQCPLDGCPFNYCSQCVWNLLLASSQPYQEASDGSKQLKVPLQCPQCRTKYPHRQIVQDVLLLRQAWRLQPLFFSTSEVNQSTLKASDLSAKQDFEEQVTWTALQESWLRVNKYLRERSNPIEGFEVDTVTDTRNRIPELPTEWKDHLAQHEKEDEEFNKPAGVGMGQANYTLVDPTLFQGMEETMTLSEQEFLSNLLVSGSVPNLMHAAQILHGMLQLMLNGGLKARQNPNLNVSSLSSDNEKSAYNKNSAYDGTAAIASGGGGNKKNLKMLTTGTRMLYPDIDKSILRKRFPLPLHMPRWIVLPVYHPDKRGVPLQFKDHKSGLQITSVKGSAGQQGIRKGDIVTHIDEESCESSTVEDFAVFMRSLYQRHQDGDDASATITMVVNAHEDTALELQKRSFEIIHFLTEGEKTQS